MRNRAAIYKIVCFLSVFSFTFFIIDAPCATGVSVNTIEKDAGVVPEDTTQAIIRPQVKYQADSFKDPFFDPIAELKRAAESLTQGPAQEAKPLPEMKVQGIIWGGKINQAIINDKVFKIGDTIEGASVIAIDKSGVVLLSGGKKYNLSSPAALPAAENKP